MENHQPAPEPPETIPDPEAIHETRKLIATLSEMVNSGKVEGVSIYVQLRNGDYTNMRSPSVSRHEDAGRMLELTMLRLGFVQKEHVEEMIEEGR